jgi:hypothetical protein
VQTLLIFISDSNKVYHAASNRVPLSSQRCLCLEGMDLYLGFIKKDIL